MLSDLRHAVRHLAKSPGFTAVAILSLAIGIGVNSTIFTAMDAAFLRPLPGRHPEEIVRFEWPQFAFGEYQQLRATLTNFSGLAASARKMLLLRGTEGLEAVEARAVSSNYFTVLGAGAAAAGTLFSERTPNLHEPIAVISHALWERRFGSNPAIVGQTLVANQTSVTIVGVAPAGFTGKTVSRRRTSGTPRSPTSVNSPTAASSRCSAASPPAPRSSRPGPRAAPFSTTPSGARSNPSTANA